LSLKRSREKVSGVAPMAAAMSFLDMFGMMFAIACPKLDEGQEVYEKKLKVLIDEAKINMLTVIIMQVPCCGGLLRLAQRVAQQCARKVPVKAIVVSLKGEILSEEWM